MYEGIGVALVILACGYSCRMATNRGDNARPAEPVDPTSIHGNVDLTVHPMRILAPHEEPCLPATIGDRNVVWTYECTEGHGIRLVLSPGGAVRWHHIGEDPDAMRGSTTTSGIGVLGEAVPVWIEDGYVVHGDSAAPTLGMD